MSTARFTTWESLDGTKSINIEDVLGAGDVEQVVANYAALLALDTSIVSMASTLGYASVNDGGAGRYYWNGSAWVLLTSGAVNVRQLGAGLGGDDTAALITALASGRNVYLPRGTYNVSSALTYTGSGHVYGDGENVTILKLNGSGYAGITLTGNYSGVRDLSIQSDSYRTSGSTVVVAGATRKNFVKNVRMQNQFLGVHIAGNAVETKLEYMEILDSTPSTGGGVFVDGGNDTFMTHVVIDSSGTEPLFGVRIQNTQAVWMTDCDVLHARTPLLIDPTSGDLITWCFFNHCAFDSSLSNGIEIFAQGTSSVRGLYFSDCWSATNNRGVYIHKDGSATLTGIEFDDCKVNNNSLHGYLIAGGSNIYLNGGNVSGNGLAASGTYAGIDFQSGLSNFGVTGLKSGAGTGFASTQAYGVLIGAGCDNYRVSLNDLTGNVTSGFADNSSGTSAVRFVQGNLGAKTTAAGQVTLTAGNTTQAFNHGLNGTPTSVLLTPLNANLGGTSFWAGSLTGSAFSVNVGAAQGGNVAFSWSASIY